MLNELGIKVNEILPEGGLVKNIKKLPQAWFNIVPYREVGLMIAIYLKKEILFINLNQQFMYYLNNTQILS